MLLNGTWPGSTKLFDVVLREIFPNLAKGCSIEAPYPLGVFDQKH